MHPRFPKQDGAGLPAGTTPVPSVAFPDTPASATPNQTPDEKAKAKADGAQGACTSRVWWLGVGAVAVAVSVVALAALRAARRKQ